MKGLLKKDLLNLSSYKTSIIILVIFCAIAIIGSKSLSLVPIALPTIMGMLVLATFNYDEAAKTDSYLLALPITKKELVLSKYILAVIFLILSAAFSIILTIVLANIIRMIQPSEAIAIDYDSLISTAFGGMFGISLIQSIQLPSIYKWGAEKGRIQMFILIFILICIIAGIGALVVNIGLPFAIDQFKAFFESYGLILLTVLIIVMYLVSYRISYRIVMKKDF